MLEFPQEQIIVQEITMACMSIRDSFLELNREQVRPCMMLKPRLFPDGNQWCALYGENLQEGVAGFGDTPARAMIQFDIEYLNATIPRKKAKIL